MVNNLIIIILIMIIIIDNSFGVWRVAVKERKMSASSFLIWIYSKLHKFMALGNFE